MLISADSQRQAAVIGSHYLLAEPFCCENIPLRTDYELDRAPGGINCAVKVLPLLTNLHVRLI